MCAQSGSELERPSWAGQSATQRESERGIVPLRLQTTQLRPREGPAVQQCEVYGVPLASVPATNQPKTKRPNSRPSYTGPLSARRRLNGEPCKGEPYARFGEGPLGNTTCPIPGRLGCQCARWPTLPDSRVREKGRVKAEESRGKGRRWAQSSPLQIPRKTKVNERKWRRNVARPTGSGWPRRALRAGYLCVNRDRSGAGEAPDPI